MSTDARDELKTRLYALITGYTPGESPDTWVAGVVDFWNDDVDADRLVDGVIALADEVAAAAGSDGATFEYRAVYGPDRAPGAPLPLAVAAIMMADPPVGVTGWEIRAARHSEWRTL